MPNTALDDVLREAFALAPSDEVYLETLEIKHISLTESIRLVRDSQAQTLTLEDGSTVDFEPCGFRVKLPTTGDNGIQEIAVGIDNTDRRISAFLDQVKESVTPVEVIYRPYLESNKTRPLMNPPLSLFLTDVVVTAIEVTGKATFADIINKKFPNEWYVRSRFPSLANQ